MSTANCKLINNASKMTIAFYSFLLVLHPNKNSTAFVLGLGFWIWSHPKNVLAFAKNDPTTL